MIVHFRPLPRTYACGIEHDGPGSITSTPHKAAVTCEECKATLTFRAAVQRLPNIPRPVWYRHV